MEITIFAYVWLAINIICMGIGCKYQIYLLLFSCVLQADKLINIEQSNFSYGPATLMTAVFIILRHILLALRSRIIVYKKDNYLSKLWRFFLYSFFITIVSAGILFKGLPIFSSQVVYTGYYFPLKVSVRAIYLGILYFIYCICARIILYDSKLLYEKDIIKVVEAISVFVIAVGILQYLQEAIGIGPTPVLSNLIYSQKINNAYYSGKVRFFSTFLEPSYTAVFFAALFWFRMVQGKKYNMLITIGLLGGMLCSLGMTGYGAFVFGGLAFLVVNTSFKKLLYIIMLGSVAFLTLYLLGWWDVIIYALLQKQYSVTRFTWNRLALELFKQTRGVGVGYGVARANSLFINLLVKTGVVGTLLYFEARISELTKYWKLRKNNSIFLGLFLYSITVLAGQIIGDPDLEFEVFWFGIFLYALTIQNKNIIFKK